MAVILINACKCEVCGHTWLPEKGTPTRCAKCKSPYWNEKRKKLDRKMASYKVVDHGTVFVDVRRRPRNPQKKANVAAKGTRQTAERV